MTKSDITQLLTEFRERGEPTDELVGLVYGELRKLARSQVARERPNHTLQATELVHEAYMKLFNNSGPPTWENRRHFYAAAAEVMRRVLVDQARRKLAKKRGQKAISQEYDDMAIAAPADSNEVLRLHDALAALSESDPEAAELVKLRYFVRLTIAESAETLGISVRSVNRLWSFARAFLKHEMQDDQ